MTSKKDALEWLYSCLAIQDVKQLADDFIKHYHHIRYCEIIVDPLGYIIEIKPSHVQTLIRLSGKTEKEIWELCPVEASPIHWLVDYTGCVAVWFDGIIAPKTGINRLQKHTLKKLIKHKKVEFKADIMQEFFKEYYEETLPRISTGAPSTLKTYQKIAYVIDGFAEKQASAFIRQKIKESPHGEDEIVVASESQVIALLMQLAHTEETAHEL